MDIKEQIKELLTEDLVNRNSTHENAPPNKDCMEECKVDIRDVIAASNPYSAPVRSGGVKHKKCYDCWDNYIGGLVTKIHSLYEQAGYLPIQAGEDGLAKNPYRVDTFATMSEIHQVNIKQTGFDEGRKAQKALDDKEKEEAVKKRVIEIVGKVDSIIADMDIPAVNTMIAIKDYFKTLEELVEKK